MKSKVAVYGNRFFREEDKQKSARTFDKNLNEKIEQWENIDARQHKNNDVPLFECFLCSKKKLTTNEHRDGTKEDSLLNNQRANSTHISACLLRNSRL